MYLLAMATLSELVMRLKMVQKQLLMDETLRLGYRQASRNTLVRSSATAPSTLTLSGMLDRLSMILQACLIKI